MLSPMSFTTSGLRGTSRLGVFLVSFVALAQACLAQAITPEFKEKIIYQASQVIEKRAYVTGVDFSKWPEHLANNREQIDGAADEPEFARALNHALAEFGVSHISLITPKTAERRKTTEQIGIGVTLEPHDDGLRVSRVVEGSAAEEAGIRPDEVIIEINGQRPPTRALVGGDEGSEVTLKVRGEDRAERDLTLKRRKFSTRRVETLTKVGEDAGVMVIPTFATGYSRETVEKLFREASGFKTLVIDLRNNGGGETRNLNHFLGCLLPKDTAIGTNVSRAVADRFAKETGGDAKDAKTIAAWSDRKWRIRENPVDPFLGRVAVLINRGSASASEIAAAALRDHKNAVLVGAATTGKVLVSSYIKITDGWEMKVPLSDYVTSSGIRLEGTRTVPDAEAPSPKRGQPDEAVQIAIRHANEEAEKAAENEPVESK